MIFLLAQDGKLSVPVRNLYTRDVGIVVPTFTCQISNRSPYDAQHSATARSLCAAREHAGSNLRIALVQLLLRWGVEVMLVDIDTRATVRRFGGDLEISICD